MEDHFTVFIRLPFPRGDFVDPPPVTWSAAKERDLWNVISQTSRSHEVDWKTLSEQFQVSQTFLLQQAAWLYERQLSQVRAQMRRMGSRSSNTASPAPGSATASLVSAAPTVRAGVSVQRMPTRLLTPLGHGINAEANVLGTPARSRGSLPTRSTTSTHAVHSKGTSSGSRPLSRQSSRDNETLSRTHSRRGSTQYQLSRSPGQMATPADDSSSEEDTTRSKIIQRRPNPSASRHIASNRRTQHNRRASATTAAVLQVDEEDDEDSPAFLPFAETRQDAQHDNETRLDPGATLREEHAPARRPLMDRRRTSERVPASSSTGQRGSDAVYSSSRPPTAPSNPPTSSRTQTAARPDPRQPPRSGLPNPLSPRQQAALAAAAGLSPRQRSQGHQQAGSDTSPSMGSSFSDLDDASVTQSALEEALMSNMGATTTTIGAAAGGVASRVSAISQALRSRHFDTRSGSGNGNGQ